MFGELKEIFQDSYDVKYFKEIKSLKSLQNTEACLKLKRASTMEPFCEIYLAAY